MSEPLTPELEAKAQELAARIKARSADAILEMARRPVATTDETLFGDTEFELRDQALGLVADAYAEHLPQKADTAHPQYNAHISIIKSLYTFNTKRRSKRSAGRSRATGRTTTAGPVAKDLAPGTGAPG
ncbi:unnamed protein product [Gemmata massiliana]|uniref:Uncharacterized protein n=1 Tax=Gemmata massiliana TaxID=1210884 RepID=A0A6P2D263_9BACT|nr:hypothetical protein [Gemmata massiliana]VTR95219.1 unnamed protein product [Gemmata massiliana]